jgi:hypothetical protein
VRSLDRGENCKREWRQMRRSSRGEKKVYLDVRHKQTASSARWDGDSETLSFSRSRYSCAHHSVFGTSATTPTTTKMTIKTWCQPRKSCCSSDMKSQKKSLHPISKSSTPNCVAYLKKIILWIVKAKKKEKKEVLITQSRTKCLKSSTLKLC